MEKTFQIIESNCQPQLSHQVPSLNPVPRPRLLNTSRDGEFLQDNTAGSSVKHFTKIQVDNIHCLSAGELLTMAW